MSDTANLRIQQQINEAIAERGKILASQTKLIADQTELALAFCKAMKCEGVDQAAERVAEIRAGLEEAAKAAQSQSDSLSAAAAAAEAIRESQEAAARAAREHEKKVDEMTKSLSKGLKFMGDAFAGASNSLSALASGVSSVATGIFNIAKAVLAIPFKIFDTLMGKAADLASASYEVAQALEEVRKQYGDISTGFASDVAQASGDMATSLGEAGLSIGKVFGHGPAGAAAAIRAALQMAQELGPAVNLLGQSFKKSAGDLLVFQKGLGLSGEDMKAFIGTAKAFGRDVSKDLGKVAVITKDLGKKFGMSTKEIARDIGYLTTNSGKFGRLTKEAMATASVMVRSYGLELKDVVGVMDQFADFESAATNAAKFAQSFGTIIDPIKLMKEENPAKSFEYLRNQMLAAGQSAETMNKAQVKQLATLSGMDENMVRLAFSNNNVGKSYEQIQKEAEKSGRKQKTQQEIFQDLGKSIERVIEALSHSGSLLEEFFTGFGEGIARSGPGRQVLRDMASLLMLVRRLGREVGKSFVESFPGVKTFFDGLSKFVRAVKGNTEKLSETFDAFFKGLSGNPTKAVKELEENFKGIFGDAGIAEMKAGASKFLKAVVGIFAGLVNLIVPKLVKGIDTFTQVLGDKEGIKKGFEKLAGKSESFLEPLFTAIVNNAGPLWESIKKMFSKGWEMYGGSITMFLGKVVFGTILVGALKAAVLSLPAAIGGLISGVLVKKLGGELGDSVMKALARKIVEAGGVRAFVSTLSPAVSRGIGMAFGATGIGLVIAAAISASDIDKIAGKALDEKLAKGELERSGAASGGKIAASLVNALTFGLLGEGAYLAIAEGVAGISDNMLKLIAGISPMLAEAYSHQLDSIFNLFAGVGDIILGIFTADGTRISDGIFKILEGLFDFAKFVPKLALGLRELMISAIGYLAKMVGSIAGGLLRFVMDLLAWPFTGGRARAAHTHVLKSLGEWWSNLDIVGAAKDGLKNAFAGLISLGASLYEGFVSAFKGKDPQAITNAVKEQLTPDANAVQASVESETQKIQTAAAESLGAIEDEVTQYSGLDSKKIAKVQKTLNDGIANMQKIISGINNQALIDMRASLMSIDTGALMMFEAVVKKVNESAETSITEQALKNLIYLDDVVFVKLGSIMGRANAVGDLAKDFNKKYSGDLVAYIEDAAGELEELDALLTDLKVGDIDTTIDNLNNKLLINNKKIKIENKPVVINMNLNVQFDALKFTTSVFTVASNAMKLDTNARLTNAQKDANKAVTDFQQGR
jgi:hypothetical protein